ncbi:MAG: ParB/RepB/Spo0J family partition protein [Clostridia bacterium]|jgi:ParB family chromosome partitioning protein|nr:ParB/RepB/Spo0J family partition protein [Clostridia bacterium]
MAKPKGLGRGLDSIFFDNTETESNNTPNTVRLADIRPRADQPRKSFDQDALEQLARSIAEHGLIQPIVVRKSLGGFYEIIAGERRWRASKLAGLEEVPTIILDSDDLKTAEISLIENIQRENLNAIEEALAYRMLIETYSLTQESVAQRVGKSRTAVTNSLRLLDLPDSVSTLVAEGKLSAGHARALLGLDDKDVIDQVALEVSEKELSVRETEELVRRLNKPRVVKNPVVVEENDSEPDYVAILEKKVRQTIGRRVKIVSGKRSKKLEIEFSDDRDLENLLTTLCGKSIFDD